MIAISCVLRDRDSLRVWSLGSPADGEAELVQRFYDVTAGKATPLFQTRFATITSRGRYRPASDGQRFLVVGPPARETEQPASVLLNWTAALRK